MSMESSVGGTLRNMQISGGMKDSVAKDLLAAANGNFIRGLKILLKRR